MSYIEKEKLIKEDIASIENRVRHAFNQGYDLGFKDGKERAKPLELKTGHWISIYGNVKCSVCGSVKDSREVGKTTHYCDFCGAKMESEG